MYTCRESGHVPVWQSEHTDGPFTLRLCFSCGEALPFPSANDTPADPQIAEAVDGAPSVTAGPAPGFRLVDAQGRSVSLSDLRGSTVVLTFLDPVCTTDCPIIAQELKVTNTLLGADSAQYVRPVLPPVGRAGGVGSQSEPAPLRYLPIWPWL